MAQKKRTKPARKKHVPQRLCIACRKPAGKQELVRLVRTSEGVEIDLTAKKAGRGAYIHPASACWQVVLQSRRIEQALRTSLSAEERRRLTEYMQSLSESDSRELQNLVDE